MLYIAFMVLIIATVILLYLSIGKYRKNYSSIGADASSVGTRIQREERREDSRVKMKWPVTIETLEGSLNGETINVSVGGAFICFQGLPRLKERFRVTMNPPNHHALQATVSIVWSNFNVPEKDIIHRGMGVRFLEISDEDRQFISKAVTDSSEPTKKRHNSHL